MTAAVTSAQYLLQNEEFFRRAVTIRRTEEALLQLAAEGAIKGTVHTAIGQELPALAVIDALRRDDWVFSNHRGHAHFLARTDDVEGLIAELMGRTTGVCGGLGGSQHLHAPRFLSNGIVGGLAPVAAGTALAAKHEGSDTIAALFIGDGALGEGVVYESFNIAARWNLPVLIVVENNGYAQSTPIATTLAGTIRARAEAFGLSYQYADSWSLPELISAATSAVASARSGLPTLLEILTYRLSPHSKGDDHRLSSEVDEYRRRDVLSVVLADEHEPIRVIDRAATARICLAIEQAHDASLALPAVSHSSAAPITWNDLPPSSEIIADSIHQFLRELLNNNPHALLIGEDLAAPYGGAFRVTRNLSQEHPDRVINTPISEAAIVGTGCGAALAGASPIVEIMFGDFLPLAFDQIANHAAKFSFLSRGAASVPLVIRTPMGGRRGYGATHSQALEKHFMGIDGLRIVALNHITTPYALYSDVVTHLDGPCLVVEHKLLYPRRSGPTPLPGFRWTTTEHPFPVVRLTPTNTQASLTIVCYGQMFVEVVEAMLLAFREAECVSEAYCLSLISPLRVDALITPVARTQAVLCVEEGSSEAGFGSEILAQLLECGTPIRKARRLGALGIIPAAVAAEDATIPNARRICDAIKELCG